MGTLHGGVLCDIADAAMGIAFASTLALESFTTVELKINFFHPVWQAELKAEGVVMQRGRTVGYVECIHRRAEPVDSKSGIYLHGAARGTIIGTINRRLFDPRFRPRRTPHK